MPKITQKLLQNGKQYGVVTSKLGAGYNVRNYFKIKLNFFF